MQALDIYRQTGHHQVDAISSLGESLIDIAESIAVDSPQRVSRDDAKSNLVGDDDERLVARRTLRYGKQRLDVLQAPFIK